MAENLLELLFKINADPSEAEAGLAKLKASTVAESTEISNLWSGAMDAITGPTGIALGAVVGLGGGMLELANKAAEAGAKMYEASETTGISAEKLSGLAALSKETGESFDNLSMGLARAGRNLQAAIIEPSAITSRVLAQVMGGAQNLAALGLKPMGEQLQIVLQHIFALNNVGERNLALSALFGRSWMTNVETLKLLAEQGYGPAIEQAKKFGIYFNEDSARQAKEFQVGMKTLNAELSGLGLVIGEKLLPSLLKLVAALMSIKPAAEAAGEGFASLLLRINPVTFAEEGVLHGLEKLWSGFEKIDPAARLAAASHKTFGDAVAENMKQIEAMVSASGQMADAVGEGLTGKGGAARATKRLSKAMMELSTVLPNVDTKMLDLAVAAQQLNDNLRVFFEVGLIKGDTGGMLPGLDKTIAQLPIATAEMNQFVATLLKVPAAAQQEIQAYQRSIQVKQQMVDISQTVVETLFQELEAHKTLAAGMQAVYQQLLKDFFSWLTSYAEKKALTDFALALDNWADPPAAAAYAAAGAAWLALGAGAAAAGGALTGKGGAAGGTRPGQGVPGPGTGNVSPRGPGGAAGYGGTQVNLYIDGVISPDTMEVIAPQLATAISTAVQNGQTQLSATSTTLRPNVTQGG